MNTRLNKKVKKDLDAYFKGYRGSEPEVHHALKHILMGALTDANFHAESKRVANMFPKANKAKHAGKKDWEDSLEQNHGVPIAHAAKWDGYEIIDAISYWASMFIGGPVGAKISSLKEGMNENIRMFVNKFINEVTHSYEYEDMSTMGEDENDKEDFRIGNYHTKYFHICPSASNLYMDIESKGVDMDMAERSARLLDVLFFVEEHIQRDGYNPEKDYIMVAKNLHRNIMKMAEIMGLENEHSFVQGHVDTIVKAVEGKKLEERVIELTEKNVPTNPSKWSYYKSQAKKKFDVYPSAYANAWAAKQYKAAGGGWRTTKESIDENEEYVAYATKGKKVVKTIRDSEYNDDLFSKFKKDMEKKGLDVYIDLLKNRKVVRQVYRTNESVNEAKSMDPKKKLKIYDKLKKGDKITIKYGSSIRSGVEKEFVVSKGKTLVGKQKVERIILKNPANPKGVKYYLYQRNGNVSMAIGDMAATIEDMHESVNEGLSVTDERHFGKKGIIIMIDDNGKKVSAIFKDKKNADKYNRNKSSDLQALLKLAKNTPYPKAIDESIEEYYVENIYDVKELVEFLKENKSSLSEAEYQGRKVELNKIMQGDVKKFKVYVNNPKGNVVKVNFGHKGKGGEKTMRIKKSDPERRKAFRARHNCDNPGPKHKARYWSCRTW